MTVFGLYQTGPLQKKRAILLKHDPLQLNPNQKRQSTGFKKHLVYDTEGKPSTGIINDISRTTFNGMTGISTRVNSV